MSRRRRVRERPLIDAILQAQPGFKEAVLADLLLERRQRGLRTPFASRRSVLREVARIALASDAFGALLLYRVRIALLRRNIPILPGLAHRGSIIWAQLSIGDPVLVEAGVRFPHGQVVIDGIVTLGSGALVRPFVTIGLREDIYRGPTIGHDVKIGTGAKIIGPITIGDGAKIGANAVVVDDVAPGTVVVGVPARPVG